MTELATNKDFSEGKFKTLAEKYRIRNEMLTFARALLGDLGEATTTKMQDEVSSGAYDADWKDAEHPKLQKLSDALRHEWERKHSIHLVQGDFYEEEVTKVGMDVSISF